MLIREITLRNLLSFGPDTPPLELRPLNVLIGPNGSGKSNFIEAIGLLQAAPIDISTPIREGGGVEEWFWKGSATENALISVKAHRPSSSRTIHHDIQIQKSALSSSFLISDERVEASDSENQKQREHLLQ